MDGSDTAPTDPTQKIKFLSKNVFIQDFIFWVKPGECSRLDLLPTTLAHLRGPFKTLHLSKVQFFKGKKTLYLLERTDILSKEKISYTFLKNLA